MENGKYGPSNPPTGIFSAFPIEKIEKRIEELKYYTPAIEDIRVGYECELFFDNKWNPHVKLILGDFYTIELKDIRTPYLTKEQIQAEGWKETGWMHNKWFEKGNYGLKLLKNYRIVIIMKDVLLDEEAERFSNGQIYLGECPSINEFRYVTKLLGI